MVIRRGYESPLPASTSSLLTAPAALFRRAVSKAGLPSEFVFHGLRHTYASDLVRQGVSLEIVAKQLGNANTVTVLNTYGHLAEHYREPQVRTRFTALDPAQQNKANRRKDELERLWAKFQRTDWRDYGKLAAISSTPTKSLAQTHKTVLDVFQRAEKQVKVPY